MRRRPVLTAVFAGLLPFAAPPLRAHAQEPQEAPASASNTLHVYTDLVQIPVLVLDNTRHTLPSLRREQFSVSIDSGPIFHPTQLHVEGDEPLSLAVLLDVSGAQSALLKDFDTTFAALAGRALKPHDTVSVFATGCKLGRSALAIPPDPLQVKLAVQHVLSAPWLYGPKGAPDGCFFTRHLWDDIELTANMVSALPGRRILLVLTDGFDHSSHNKEPAVAHFASSQSVAVFGIEPKDLIAASSTIRGHDDEFDFPSLCASTGGIAWAIDTRQLSTLLDEFMSQVRGRYIIEFPRIGNATSGFHSIDVSVTQKSALVFSGGITVPLRDKALLDDPNTIPTDLSHAPQQGKRHPLAKKN